MTSVVVAAILNEPISTGVGFSGSEEGEIDADKGASFFFFFYIL